MQFSIMNLNIIKYIFILWKGTNNTRDINYKVFIKKLWNSENNIIIQYKYPSNTAENIAYVYKKLKEKNVKKHYFSLLHFTVEDQ